MSALLQEKNQLSLFGMSEEVQLYHDSQRHGFFSILQNVKSTKRQRSYKLAEMPQVLSLLDPSRDSWMSQAEFFKPNRRVVNLWRVGLLFVDIDSYNVPGLERQPIDYLVGALLFYCDDLNIPAPSIVVFSGRGLQVKWLLDIPLPSAALPRWNACQRVLVDKLRHLGADPQAKDASRVLRLVQTTNRLSIPLITCVTRCSRLPVSKSPKCAPHGKKKKPCDKPNMKQSSFMWWKVRRERD